MISLRPYQEQGKSDIRAAYRAGNRSIIYVLPTGGGKTTIFASIASDAAAKGNRILILCHRVELIDQISGALKSLSLPHGFIAAGYPASKAQTTIASVQTLIKRVGKIEPPQLIVVDEAHHARAATYEKILKAFPQAKILGVTATPVRQGGEGLGALFQSMVLGPAMAELISAGFLSKYRLFSPPTVDTSSLHSRAGEFIASESAALLNRPAITGSALAHYQQHAKGLPALVFCVSVQHAKDVAEQFRGAGCQALTLNGAMDRDIRRGIVADFRAGKIQVITSCEVLSEGFDVPGAHCGIFLRPTESLGLYLQQIGRVLRPCEGKDHAILLDHVGNAMRHGLPDQDRDWELGLDRPKRVAGPPVKCCPECFRILPSACRECPDCHHIFDVADPHSIREVEGELEEITPEVIARRNARKAQGRAQSLDALKEIERSRGYRAGWAEHVFAARQKKPAPRAQ